jgi:hypothetical protein
MPAKEDPIETDPELNAINRAANNRIKISKLPNKLRSKQNSQDQQLNDV